MNIALSHASWADLQRLVKVLRVEVDQLEREMIQSYSALQAVSGRNIKSNLGIPIELKFIPGAATKISGYASVFGVVDYGKDIILPGAFADSLAEHKRAGTPVVMLWAHNLDEPIGVWDKIVEDAHGLYVEGRLLPNVRRAAEAIELIAAGATSGLSIGYRVLEADKSDEGVRRISKIQLFEISIVPIPMNTQARLDKQPKEYSGFEMQGAMDKLKHAVQSLMEASSSW